VDLKVSLELLEQDSAEKLLIQIENYNKGRGNTLSDNEITVGV